MPLLENIKSGWPAVLSATLLLGACGGGGGGGGGDGDSSSACPADTEKSIILEILQLWYFWNDEPDQQNKYFNLNPDNFSDGDDLLDFLRYRPDEFDRDFSYITTVEEDDRFFKAGEVAAFGIGIQEQPDEVWLTDVFEGSPAETGGLARSDRIVSIDGRSITDIQNAEGVFVAFGPSEVGVTRTLGIVFGGGGTGEVVLSKAVFGIEAVPWDRVQTFNAGGRQVGYLQLRSFVEPAEDALRAAFGLLGGQGIQDLVVDLRYNGGGLVHTAQVLASLMAGTGSPGFTFAELRFNSDRATNDETIPFRAEAESLSLEKLIFITTSVSASASELVINSLKPYETQFGFEVMIVGDDTFGKPVGQDAFNYCLDPDTGEYVKRLRAITFEIVNVSGEGGYFDGLSVGCPAADDLRLPLGDPTEASLAAALELAETGICPGTTLSNKQAARLSTRMRKEAGGTAARLAGVW